jgi:hypothetical protein
MEKYVQQNEKQPRNMRRIFLKTIAISMGWILEDTSVI